MRAIVFEGAGGVEVIQIRELPDPRPGPEELLVRVRASALNRADTLQRSGEYGPPPSADPDAIDIPGVEIAGEVMGWGPGVTGFARGDRVFGLVSGGGYAELCPLDAGMAVRMPDGWSFEDAVSLPEVFYTADTTLFQIGRLAAGEAALIHAGGSGVGTACIQLAHHVGARVFCTVGSWDKAKRAEALGADHAILYKEKDFVAEVLARTEGQGVDLIEDFVGGSYLNRNLAALKPLGRLIQVGLLEDIKAEIDMEMLLMKRLEIRASVMRPLPIEEKRAITARFRERWWPLLQEGRLKPIVDAIFPFEDVAHAHEHMEANKNFGKIVLRLA